ncbi:hypothetical protein ES705_16783 [subsurface metagenome]
MTKKRRKNTEFKTTETKKKRWSNLKQFQNKTPGEIESETKKVEKTKKKLQDLNIIEFATGKDWLNISFKKRPAQEVILRVIYGLPLNNNQLKIYRKITKNKKEFEAEIEKEEAILVLGARSGKSLLASIIALYEATRKKWAKYLMKGESGYCVVISTKQRQSEQIIGANCLRLMENSPNLEGYIRDHTQSELILKNNMRILSLPCTTRAGLGLPIICLIMDEIGHFYTEGARADKDVYDYTNPRRAQFPGSKLIMISTPSAKQGLLWDFFDKGFKEHKRLTAQSDTLFMNPLVDKNFLEKEKKRDIDSYRREFLARFAERVEAFLSYDLVVNSLKLAGDLPFKSEYQYFCGIDASGLAGRDKFSLAIAHEQENGIYVDKVKSWDLKDPDPIMKDIKELAGIYNFVEVNIDRYAKGWVKNALEKIGLEVNIRPSLAEIYVNVKSLMLGDRLYLPDNQGIKKAFLNTQAFYGRNNALSIAHSRDPEGHSDEADAIATAVFEITREEKQEDTGKLLDDMSDNVKADMRMGRSKRLSSQYDEEMRNEADEDWGGASGETPRGDW